MSVNKTQLAVLIGTLGLIVLLLFADTSIPAKKEEKETVSTGSAHGSIDFAELILDAKKSLQPALQDSLARLETQLNADDEKAAALQSIAALYAEGKQHLASAYYYELAAIESPTEKNWVEAAYMYYKLARFTPENNRSVIYNKAIEGFKKAVDINPNNLDAIMNLASCYVEGGSQPMMGIKLLQEVEKIDSNNVKLQMSFAYFSMKSGQLDKAVKRLNKVLAIDSSFIDVYLHLADVYRQKGETENEINSLEQYVALSDNEELKIEIQRDINKLKH